MKKLFSFGLSLLVLCSLSLTTAVGLNTNNIKLNSEDEDIYWMYLDETNANPYNPGDKALVDNTYNGINTYDGKTFENYIKATPNGNSDSVILEFGMLTTTSVGLDGAELNTLGNKGIFDSEGKEWKKWDIDNSIKKNWIGTVARVFGDYSDKEEIKDFIDSLDLSEHLYGDNERKLDYILTEIAINHSFTFIGSIPDCSWVLEYLYYDGYDDLGNHYPDYFTNFNPSNLPTIEFTEIYEDGSEGETHSVNTFDLFYEGIQENVLSSTSQLYNVETLKNSINEYNDYFTVYELNGANSVNSANIIKESGITNGGWDDYYGVSSEDDNDYSFEQTIDSDDSLYYIEGWYEFENINPRTTDFRISICSHSQVHDFEPKELSEIEAMYPTWDLTPTVAYETYLYNDVDWNYGIYYATTIQSGYDWNNDGVAELELDGTFNNDSIDEHTGKHLPKFSSEPIVIENRYSNGFDLTIHLSSLGDYTLEDFGNLINIKLETNFDEDVVTTEINYNEELSSENDYVFTYSVRGLDNETYNISQVSIVDEHGEILYETLDDNEHYITDANSEEIWNTNNINKHYNQFNDIDYDLNNSTSDLIGEGDDNAYPEIITLQDSMALISTINEEVNVDPNNIDINEVPDSFNFNEDDFNIKLDVNLGGYIDELNNGELNTTYSIIDEITGEVIIEPTIITSNPINLNNFIYEYTINLSKDELFNNSYIFVFDINDSLTKSNILHVEENFDIKENPIDKPTENNDLSIGAIIGIIIGSILILIIIGFVIFMLIKNKE